MAYFSREQKQKIMPLMRDLLKQYGLKGSLSVRHRSTVVLTVRQGSIDFIEQVNQANRELARMRGEEPHEISGNVDVNVYHVDRVYTGEALEFLRAALRILNEGNHDNSDLMTDYFDVGWYVEINIGRWDKPYALVK